MHRLLKRQIKRYLGDYKSVPNGWEKFLKAVGEAYEQEDINRRMLERTIDLNSQELLELNSQMRAAIPDTFLRMDKQGIVLDYKPGQGQNAYLFFPEVVGKYIQTLLPETVSHQLIEAIKALEPNTPAVSVVHSLQASEGHEHFYEVRLLPLLDSQVVAIVRDITERVRAEAALKQSQLKLKDKTQRLAATIADLKNAQAQLVQTEKMSGLGQLVAGIAHEINNPVNFVRGNVTHIHDYIRELTQLLMLYQTHYPKPVEAIRESIEDIDLAFLLEDCENIQNSMNLGIRRISDIVRSLRTFSRLDEADMKSVNIHDGIESTLLILNHRLQGGDRFPEIEIQKDYGELPQVECYAGQLNQVFMNVIANAIDALQESSFSQHSPKITIRTKHLHNSVAIQIVNNGLSIPDSIRNKLFDPFFTTKQVGSGIGLGLSISYQIVERHGGKMWCHSAPDQDTEFCIEIPIQL